jgi:hypothetical protein
MDGVGFKNHMDIPHFGDLIISESQSTIFCFQDYLTIILREALEIFRFRYSTSRDFA